MDQNTALPPGVNLAFMVALTIIVLVPLAGWLVLAGRRTRPVQVWYSGLAAFAMASLVFTLTPVLGQAFVGLLPGTLALTCLVLLIESLRLESQGGETRWKVLWLPPVYLVVQWALLQVGRREFEGVLLQQVMIFSMVLRLLWLLTQMRRTERSRGLMFIQLGTLLLAAMNLLRVGFILVEGRDPGLLGLRPISNLLFVGSAVTPVFWGLGYWGFVLERSTRRAALAAAQKEEESRRLKQAQDHAEKLEAVIRERDRMILLNSRFAAINNLAVFSGGIVHELSQPLQSLVLSAQELGYLLDQTEPDATALKRETEAISRRSFHALSIIQGLRSVMGSTSADTERLKLRDVVNEVIEVVMSECGQRGIALEIQDELGAQELHVEANRVLLQRVLFNLLGNAIHALGSADPGKEAHRIVLRLDPSIAEDATPLLTISVTDNGPGLPPHVLRSDEVLIDSGKQGGLGFGLTLVKSLMGLWQGHFDIQSPLPDGAQGTRVLLGFRMSNSHEA